MTGPSLYNIWKSEKRIWLEGLAACRDLIADDAIIVGPEPYQPIHFSDLIPLVSDAEPFQGVDFSDKKFILKSAALVISYNASANHIRYKRNYCAACVTSYAYDDGKWGIISHSQTALKRGSL